MDIFDFFNNPDPDLRNVADDELLLLELTYRITKFNLSFNCALYDSRSMILEKKMIFVIVQFYWPIGRYLIFKFSSFDNFDFVVSLELGRYLLSSADKRKTLVTNFRILSWLLVFSFFIAKFSSNKSKYLSSKSIRCNFLTCCRWEINSRWSCVKFDL